MGGLTHTLDNVCSDCRLFQINSSYIMPITSSHGIMNITWLWIVHYSSLWLISIKVWKSDPSLTLPSALRVPATQATPNITQFFHKSYNPQSYIHLPILTYSNTSQFSTHLQILHCPPDLNLLQSHASYCSSNLNKPSWLISFPLDMSRGSPLCAIILTGLSLRSLSLVLNWERSAHINIVFQPGLKTH